MKTKIQELHERAVALATTHIKSEAALVSVLQEIDATKTYLEFGARSLYDYCQRVLKLSEGTSYNLITVARRAVDVPALRKAVESGDISVSKARRIAPVLTKENQAAWLELAATKSSREIERAVADANPKAAQEERYEYLSSDFTRATLDIPDALMKKLRRIQDLESQRLRKHATMAEVLEAIADEYIERKDPVMKADRALKRNEVKAAKISTPGFAESAEQNRSSGAHNDRQLGTGRVRTIPAAVRHAVYFRDQGRCTFEDENGRCDCTRWLDIHHVVPRSEGGLDTLENLVLVCNPHHSLIHNGSTVRSPMADYVA